MEDSYGCNGSVIGDYKVVCGPDLAHIPGGMMALGSTLVCQI